MHSARQSHRLLLPSSLHSTQTFTLCCPRLGTVVGQEGYGGVQAPGDGAPAVRGARRRGVPLGDGVETGSMINYHQQFGLTLFFELNYP
jgi:hypothetical protein